VLSVPSRKPLEGCEMVERPLWSAMMASAASPPPRGFVESDHARGCASEELCGHSPRKSPSVGWGDGLKCFLECSLMKGMLGRRRAVPCRFGPH